MAIVPIADSTIHHIANFTVTLINRVSRVSRVRDSDIIEKKMLSLLGLLGLIF